MQSAQRTNVCELRTSLTILFGNFCNQHRPTLLRKQISRSLPELRKSLQFHKLLMGNWRSWSASSTKWAHHKHSINSISHLPWLFFTQVNLFAVQLFSLTRQDVNSFSTAKQLRFWRPNVALSSFNNCDQNNLLELPHKKNSSPNRRAGILIKFSYWNQLGSSEESACSSSKCKLQRHKEGTVSCGHTSDCREEWTTIDG